MIRPFTLVTLMLACGSGAYLFVVKHRATGLDERISGITGQIRSAEQRIRVLQAEWAQENDPTRLAALAARFTALKPMAPSQLTTLADLANTLPAPGAGLPHLPLPPPPPWSASQAAPPPAAVDPTPGVTAPVASAGSIRPAGAVMAATMPKVTRTALLAPPMPAPKPFAARPLHAAHHPARRAAPHGGFQYVAAAPPRATVLASVPLPPPRIVPRYAAATPYRSPASSYRTYYHDDQPARPAASQSVFGGLGADLPPPQPVYRSPR